MISLFTVRIIYLLLTIPYNFSLYAMARRHPPPPPLKNSFYGLAGLPTSLSVNELNEMNASVLLSPNLEMQGIQPAIKDHINQSGHAASLKDLSVLDRTNNEFDLLIHESLLFLWEKLELNSRQSPVHLVFP